MRRMGSRHPIKLNPLVCQPNPMLGRRQFYLRSMRLWRVRDRVITLRTPCEVLESPIMNDDFKF